LTDGKDYPEARFTVHHASVRVCGTFQGNRFDHRTNVFEVAQMGDVDIPGASSRAALCATARKPNLALANAA
jgi:hypothetical protein